MLSNQKSSFNFCLENRIKLIRRCIFAAFGYGDEEDISIVYLKPDDYGNINYSEYDLENSLEKFLNQVSNCEITKKNRNIMINKFNDIMYSTLHWSLPRYHGHINDIFEDIQTNKLVEFISKIGKHSFEIYFLHYYIFYVYFKFHQKMNESPQIENLEN